MDENDRPPEQEPDPKPALDEEDSSRQPALQQATGDAIDVDAAHDRSS